MQQQLDVRPNLAQLLVSGLPPNLGASSSSKSAANTLELKHQLSVLVEGRSEGLSALAEYVAEQLPGLQQACAPKGATAGPATTAAAAAAGGGGGEGSSNEGGSGGAGETATPAPAADGTADGSSSKLTAQVLRGLIQDVAARKCYSIKDGECCVNGLGAGDVPCLVWTNRVLAIVG